ncbi:MAG: exonuclease domain-containing protein [Gammaproteobacteria bacterium]|nr:exonuclease domain-containing protein [Gammaproteobacteria bacterium]MDH3372843.1 exonuclease domain-containing protein [Gammaproteobacteria bacterium]MDH3407997.1 exonuclease domain-containing protein [Gammaproteobacteria bacterium]MDH3552432.1 exonuclease domain-containing protein [Gammaproteobacteria bacterium]
MSYDQTHWIPVQQRRPLPTFYYHGHFLEMLDFVDRHYAHVLLDSHVAFLDDFRALPRKAQCLYVRLVNRKGRVFAANRLRYPEIGSTWPIVQTLRERGWVGTPDASHYHDILGFLTKAEIYDVLMPRFAGLGRSLRKDELIAFARDNARPDDFMSGLNTERLLVQRRSEECRYLLFLYFGRVKDGLSQFTMRDLGIVRTNDFHDAYEPRFSDSVEALEHYYFATRLKTAQQANSGALQALIEGSMDWPETNFSSSAALRDELAYRLGRKAERANEINAALMLYRRGESAQCSERVIRLLLAAGLREQAKRHLERCLDEPRSDEEWLFARDLYERKFANKRRSVQTDVLRAAETIDIDESKSGSPERAAIEYYENCGFQAFRTENLLWRTLFGLLFWDELFTDETAALHSPFEFLPASLANGSFYDQHRDRIEAKLSLLHEDPAVVRRQLLKVSAQYYGTPNGLFRWRRSMGDALFALLESSGTDALATILRRICQDYANSRYGYPDLMVVGDNRVRFVEIKTEGDQLRRNQLLRLQQLRNAGFRADVVRVRWVLDPDQVYVVVDVETTGGRGDNHRVTEIGAVKVRNGKVIDRFQTLLNPQRSIPPNITRLTGISPAMVLDAPCFVDVADAFEVFMQDAIFVAHNVEFDFGFIAREFRRLGRSFRYPKLCTCAAMRKLYPGQSSYSLASLSRAFDIPLKQHHRAMCDAEAAAELLLLINEKREERV